MKSKVILKIPVVQTKNCHRLYKQILPWSKDLFLLAVAQKKKFMAICICTWWKKMWIKLVWYLYHIHEETKMWIKICHPVKHKQVHHILLEKY